MGRLSILCAAVALLGCQTEVGECDPVAARAPIYYDDDGFPAYPGQALVQASCGNGARCHSEGIDPASREGAPAGLELYVGAAREPGELDRLRRARRVAWNLRHDIYAQVLAGTMPPGVTTPPDGGTAPVGGFLGVPFHAHVGTPDVRPLPPLASAEGQEILRNWLACGAHVIEGVTEPSEGVGDIAPQVATCSSGADCGAGQLCRHRACVCSTPGLTACGGACVDTGSDPAHCGACGRSCGGRFCADGACVDACPAGTTDCGLSCADLSTNVAHCGGCGNLCESGSQCVSGACACLPGLADCGDGCADLQSSAQHCGACGNACAGGAECTGGACACGGGTTDCGGTCANIQTDPAHCGGCGMACAPGDGCAAGTCVACGPEVAFAQVESIFVRSCTTNCHSGTRPSGGLDLTEGRVHSSLVNVPASCGSNRLVTPGDVGRSYLWNKLTGVDMCSGSQMPKRGESLPPADLEVIESWICHGASDG